MQSFCYDFARHMKKSRKVIIVLRLAGVAGRDILSGIFLYTRRNSFWHTRIFQMPNEFTPENFATLEDEGYDGIIASETGPQETAMLLAKSTMPIAFIGDPGPLLRNRKCGIFHVRNDDNYIGRQGARHLVSLGSFRSYGFIPAPGDRYYWSNDREMGFRQELAERGFTCNTFHSSLAFGSEGEQQDLKHWIANLPKPSALMAAWDVRATHAINICNEAGINVPREVKIIGVDNDELLDEATTPPLTSILPDHEKLGYVAARELDKMMCRPTARIKGVFLARPKRLVERESTLASAPAAHIIRRALDYISRHATNGIRANDVANYLGISRRLVDLRFSQFNGESINETITAHKLNAVRKLLATTSRSIKSISTACGYNNLEYLKTLFKRRYGITMSEFRAQNHT